MSFGFLHPEFFAWMLLPVAVLFYFWQTQRTLEIQGLDERVVKRLSVKGDTLGLKGRNGLFFTSALLLITVLAQPVVFDDHDVKDDVLKVVLAVDIGDRGMDKFINTQTTARNVIGELQGNEIGCLVFADEIFRIAPLTRQYGILSSLIANLTPMEQSKGLNIPQMLERLVNTGNLDSIDALVVISSYAASEMKKSGDVLVVSIRNNGDISHLKEAISALRESKNRRSHIPLFYYPLGLAMILILLALSSMSKRQSVPVAMISLIVMLQPLPSDAGMLDFQILAQAKECYERGEYVQSEKLFAQYQRVHDSPYVRYNRANSLYKQQRFEEALYWYRQVYTTDEKLREYTQHNMAATRRLIVAMKQESSDKEPESHAPVRNDTVSKRTISHIQGKTRLFLLR